MVVAITLLALPNTASELAARLAAVSLITKGLVRGGEPVTPPRVSAWVWFGTVEKTVRAKLKTALVLFTKLVGESLMSYVFEPVLVKFSIAVA